MKVKFLVSVLVIISLLFIGGAHYAEAAKTNGLVYKLNIESVISDKTHNVGEKTVYIRDGKCKIEDSQRQIDTIYDTVGKKTITLYHKSNTYYDLPYHDPEFSPEEEQYFITRSTGDKDKINGYNCEKYEILTDPNAKEKMKRISIFVWVTNDIKGDFDVSTVLLPMSQLNRWSKFIKNDMKNGFPIRIEFSIQANMNFVMLHNISDVQMKNIDQSTFEVPKTFSKKEIDKKPSKVMDSKEIPKKEEVKPKEDSPKKK